MKINNKRIIFIVSVIISSVFNVLLYSSIGIDLTMRLLWGSIGLCSVVFQAISIREYFKTKKLVNLLFYMICTLGSIAGTVGTGWAQINKVSPIAKRIEIENNILAIDKVFKTSKKLNQWAVISMLKKKENLKKEEINISTTEKKISNSLTGMADLFNIENKTIAFIFLIFTALIIEMMVFGTASYEELPREDKQKKKSRINKILKEELNGQIMFNTKGKNG